MSMQPPVPQQARILVIDDEPDLRTLYELTLLREGYRVEAAGDLLQARQQLSENRFDAVITDMSALEAAAAAAQAQMNATPATDIKFCAIDDPGCEACQ